MSPAVMDKQSSAKGRVACRSPMNYYPEGVSHQITYSGDTLVDKFRRAALRYSGRPGCEFFGREMRYNELARLSNQVAGGLHAQGVKKGDRVALLLPNCPYYPIFYFAILRLGAVVVNCNPLYSEGELEEQLKDAGVGLVVTVNLKLTADKLFALLKKRVVAKAVLCDFAACLPQPKRLLFKILKGGQIASPARLDGLITMQKMLKNAPPPPSVQLSPDDTAVLQYTGGTTGVSKGAVLSHRNLAMNVEQALAWFPTFRRGQERILCVLPFFHVFAMTALMNLGLFNGAVLIMTPRFELKQTLGLFHRRKPTVFAGVPSLFNAINNYSEIKRYKLTSLRFCISGGAPLPHEVGKAFEAICRCRVVEGYGLSETSPMLTCNPVGGSVKRNSVGLPVPGVEVSLRRLDDPNKEVTKLGDKGEVCARGANIMSGYWRRKKESRQAFIGEYFRTGDVGYMDQDGFIYLVDRIKDLILVNGYNVYPRNIEDAIYKHPKVEEAVVLGVKDAAHGEVPSAYIKLKDGKLLTAEELRDFLSRHLSPIELPRHFEFRDSLPKTPIGKISRLDLRKAEGI